MPCSRADAQRDGGYFMRGKGDAEGQSEKYEHRKLNEASAATRQRREQVRDQRDKKNKQLF